MADPRVTVRMYQGLMGDCFLLRLFDANADGRNGVAAANILIDCGVLQNVPDEAARIARVTADIAAITGGHIDLLVVTHEHYDHVSGFGHARSLFLDGGLTIGTLWLAWTERAGNEQADALRKVFAQTRKAVQAGVQRIRLAGEELAGGGEGLEDFLGPQDGLAVSTAGLTVAQIIDGLKERVRPAPEDYLEPGTVRTTPGKLGLRAYVLGPPHDEDLLFRDRPSRKLGEGETYFGAWMREAFEIEQNFAPASGRSLLNMPFGSVYGHVADKPFLDEGNPGPAPEDPAAAHALWRVRQKYLDDPERMIGSAWHGAVSQLAIKLDSDTNNASLVLAFELSPGGDIMLFAADAQVGNWLSWHEQNYPADDQGTGLRVTAGELLARTTLYKVGHHGSHNATLRALGLELMTSDRLTALVPVMEELAERRRWGMPFSAMYERLVEKCRGRVLRGDRPPDPAVLAAQPDFEARIRIDPAPDAKLGPAWIEYDAS
ncbi:MBL fold metallo-hydrolase [Sphingomonas quercus]|uniref:MBL fold metallo-hydrolase n=1 Tax=Sphingomonas quercus TaxID=2842451 RepID=A0ABS6BI18_9SPHN|nr:MBL fold metallo-hydrolase [Sphingomonas quercus]MBU3077954.1 MBL fold metallo-hydrolase [Sphingomonas quercus]